MGWRWIEWRTQGFPSRRTREVRQAEHDRPAVQALGRSRHVEDRLDHFGRDDGDRRRLDRLRPGPGLIAAGWLVVDRTAMGCRRQECIAAVRMVIKVMRNTRPHWVAASS